MVLWSTKDNPLVDVNGMPWKPSGRPGYDEDKGLALDGMVCAWWFDGQQMHEPVIQENLPHDCFTRLTSKLAPKIR